MSKRFNTIDGTNFIHMLLAASQLLSQRSEQVNALNVFPVPDGDTGTNMSLTLSFGVEELKKRSSAHIGQAADALSKGLLMGARGNSGVILSQLFRGLAKGLHDHAEANPAQFAAALQEGVDTAYKAVVRPVEGTILTVAKEAARHATAYARRFPTVNELMEDVVRRAQEALDRTPEQLPALKQVGVVDAGGQGLLIIYEGFLQALNGTVGRSGAELPAAVPAPAAAAQPAKAQAQLATEDIKHPYDMEFFIDRSAGGGTAAFQEPLFRSRLEQLGDSVIVIPDGDLVKVHVHSSRPGDVLNEAIRYGELHRIHILNMKDQHRELLAEPEERSADSLPDAAAQARFGAAAARKPYGLIAVAAGDGVTEIFSSLGVDIVLSGGQTMNPSTEDFVNAIRELGAETVFLLPNNSNIILAAQQAREHADCRVEVIPTKTIPQGMAAALAFRKEAGAEENAADMTNAIGTIRSGQVTYAVRDSSMDGLDIRKDDYLAILDHKIIATGPDLFRVSAGLLDAMADEGGEMIAILTGEGADDAVTDRLQAHIAELYPEMEMEVHTGGQPVYAYIFSVE